MNGAIKNMCDGPDCQIYVMGNLAVQGMRHFSDLKESGIGVIRTLHWKDRMRAGLLLQEYENRLPCPRHACAEGA